MRVKEIALIGLNLKESAKFCNCLKKLCNDKDVSIIFHLFDDVPVFLSTLDKKKCCSVFIAMQSYKELEIGAQIKEVNESCQIFYIVDKEEYDLNSYILKGHNCLTRSFFIMPQLKEALQLCGMLVENKECKAI